MQQSDPLSLPLEKGEKTADHPYPSLGEGEKIGSFPPLTKGRLGGVFRVYRMGTLFNQETQTPLRQQLRNRMTHAEKILWYYLRGKGLDGYKFRRQHGIGPYVVDFYCVLVKLAIEIDGDSHYRGDVDRKDFIRQQAIEAMGIRVLRFTDNDVRESIAGVVGIIKQYLKGPPPLTPPQ